MGKRPKLAKALARAQEVDARKKKERELATAQEERLKKKGKGKAKDSSTTLARHKSIVPFQEGDRILLVGEGTPYSNPLIERANTLTVFRTRKFQLRLVSPSQSHS
jgi:hypothetical protein